MNSEAQKTARRTLTGAWIETRSGSLAYQKMIVAPSRVRGLKLHARMKRDGMSGRTLTGAWIETGKIAPGQLSGRVAPSRVRGLKL